MLGELDQLEDRLTVLNGEEHDATDELSELIDLTFHDDAPRSSSSAALPPIFGNTHEIDASALLDTDSLPLPVFELEDDDEEYLRDAVKALNQLIDAQPAIKQDLTPEQPAQQQAPASAGVEPHCYMDEYGNVRGSYEYWMECEGGWFPVYTSPQPAPVAKPHEQQDYWQEEARRYAQNADFWRGKYESATAQQQEPVTWMHTNAIGHVYFRKNPQDKTLNPVPLYTSPPASKPWVGLTSEEVYACDQESGLPQREITTGDLQAFAQCIEAKLKEKNA